MKTAVVTLITLVLLSSVVFAAAGDPTLSPGNVSNQSDASPSLGNQEMTQTTAQIQIRQAESVGEVREMVQTRQTEMNQEQVGMSEPVANVYQNQNRVRLAVHALVSMENMVGGFGPQVSAIANQMNSSVQVTIQAEERIQTRNTLVKFLVGGDAEAASQIETETVQNQQRLQQLTQLKEQCECSEEVKAMLQEQIQEMEQEQTRLRTLAQAEIDNKGLFGWLFR